MKNRTKPDRPQWPHPVYQAVPRLLVKFVYQEMLLFAYIFKLSEYSQ
jgi:hypothetical protein